MSPNAKKPLSQNSRKQAARVSRRNLEIAQSRATAGQTAASTNRSTYGAQNRPDAAGGGGFGKGPRLRIVPLGGLGEVGRNMNIIEYGNDAIVVDAGFRLGIDLPGINYAIPDFTYFEQIKHKLRGYVFTHGHLDHIGAMPYLLPLAPAPVYGSRFTLDMLERQMLDRDPNTRLDKRYINPELHEKVVIGPFRLELARVTHSIPDSTAAIIETPLGKIVHTGDFRIDPSPLDGRLTDLERLRQIGNEGVLLLMSDSTRCEVPGRSLTEKVIEPTLLELFKRADGRLIVSAVSTNINRVQMIINAVVSTGRKIAIDGRSMLANIELAIRSGFIRIPKGTIVPMRDVARIGDRELAIISTGHQGELGSVLMRMASGDHKFIKLKPTDTVILSASPIPGNEKAVALVVDGLMREGTRVYQQGTREIDAHGVLHVGGHGLRDELSEMIMLTRPKYFMPIHGDFRFQVRHAELAAENGIPKPNIFVLDNGDVFEIGEHTAAKTGRVPAGTQLVDQTGEIVPGLVIKDRLLMSQDGIVVIVLTIDRASGQNLSSPDIITRGFIYVKESEELMNSLRTQLVQFGLRRFNKVEINRFKQELRDEINSFLFSHTGRSPLIIPVVNAVGGGRGSDRPRSGPAPVTKPPA